MFQPARGPVRPPSASYVLACSFSSRRLFGGGNNQPPLIRVHRGRWAIFRRPYIILAPQVLPRSETCEFPFLVLHTPELCFGFPTNSDRWRQLGRKHVLRACPLWEGR